METNEDIYNENNIECHCDDCGDFISQDDYDNNNGLCGYCVYSTYDGGQNGKINNIHRSGA